MSSNQLSPLRMLSALAGASNDPLTLDKMLETMPTTPAEALPINAKIYACRQTWVRKDKAHSCWQQSTINLIVGTPDERLNELKAACVSFEMVSTVARLISDAGCWVYGTNSMYSESDSDMLGVIVHSDDDQQDMVRFIGKDGIASPPFQKHTASDLQKYLLDTGIFNVNDRIQVKEMFSIDMVMQSMPEAKGVLTKADVMEMVRQAGLLQYTTNRHDRAGTPGIYVDDLARVQDMMRNAINRVRKVTVS